MPTRNEVLRLQFLPGARREAHAKMRQALVPGAGHAHLFRAVFGGEFRNGMKIPGGQLRPEKFRGRVKWLAILDASFYPNLIETLLLPVGEQADAVRACFDSIKVIFHLS